MIIFVPPIAGLPKGGNMTAKVLGKGISDGDSICMFSDGKQLLQTSRYTVCTFNVGDNITVFQRIDGTWQLVTN